MEQPDGNGNGGGLVFEWDDHKAWRNRKDHEGITFDEASSVFRDPLARYGLDRDHSWDEDRGLIIGRSDRGNLLVVSYTERGYREGRQVIRIISARKATVRERRDYEESR